MNEASEQSCQHERIITWRIEETNEPAGLWSCAACNHKFVPLVAAPQAEARQEQPDSVYLTSRSGEAATARALVDGYVSGACSVTGDAATASVTLHYMTGDQAEAAFDAITAAIDAALSSTPVQGDGVQEVPRG